VTFSRDSLLLAAAGATAAIHLWDLPNYFERHSLACDVTVNALAFTADALLLASGGMDKKVRVWDSASGSCLQQLVHDDYVLALAFAPAQRAPEVRQLCVRACVHVGAPRSSPPSLPSLFVRARGVGTHAAHHP
jgi:WD40 repeat protein